ncbi:MAG: HEAT repeat domain-containing protein [Promethearchaeota archaeon]
MIIETILLTIFLTFFAFGFYIIYRQVALVKKGEFVNKDRFQCIFYGIIFSFAVMVVVVMGFIFAIETFWEGTPPDLHPLALIIPFILILVYISIYPLIDFLFIALSKETDEGLTPFHKFIGDRVINLSERKIARVSIAIVFYIFVFIVPPLILTLFGAPFIMIWISWMIVYPLMILTFYGSKGYIAGISNAYYHIPNVNRSIFLNFEDRKRGMKQFTSEPGPYIIIGLMIFVFIWAWISLFQTITFFFTGNLAFSTMSSVFVFVTLFFGIIGYFTRFWGRKIKYRGIDIYFAAYLMAAIGINVLVNFLIVNYDKLSNTFNSYNITSQIVPNYRIFTWAAVIEEIILIIFTSYYILARNNKFIKNIRSSKVTECGQNFDPIPLFNLIKHRDPEIRRHAESTLLLMFERIPLRKEIDLNEWKFKNSLLDAICDNNFDSRRISSQILEKLEEDAPEIILPWIIELIESPNYDKNIPIVRSLLNTDIKFVSKLPKDTILNLLNDSEWRLKLLGLKLLRRIFDKNDDIYLKLDIKKLINDSNSKIQIEILNLLSETSLKISGDIIIDKIFHKNDEIRAAAIKNLKYLNQAEYGQKLLKRIIPLMKDSSSLVRASVFKVITRIGKFKKNKIPFLPLLDGLTDFDERVRESAKLALLRYYEEEPNLLELEEIINKIEPNNIDTLISILSLLGMLWNQDPQKILTTLLIFIKFENEQLKTNISKTIVEKYQNNPDLIIQNLIKIPDISGFITKGIIAKTLIKIGQKDPKNIIPILINFLGHTNDDVKLNSLSTLDGLIDYFPKDTDIKPFIDILQEEKNNQIKKESSKVISKLAKRDSEFIKPLISEFIQLLDKQESSTKIVLFKSLLEIAIVLPEIIPMNTINKFLSDPDSFIRETNIKILGHIGYRNALMVANVLINVALVDEEWIVREAAVSSLGNIIQYIDDKKEIIQNLVTLLEGEKSWVRRSVLIILSKIKEVNETYVPFEILRGCLTSKDSEVREASANLLTIYNNRIGEIFDEIIELLGDDVIEVRNSTINSVVNIIQTVGFEEILSKLLKNLSDEGTIEVQRSIALILGRTTRYSDENIKKRVISLLKIRCEMSQDPVICDTLQKLKEV